MKIGVMLRHLGQPGGIGVYTSSLLNSLLTIDQKNIYYLIYNTDKHLNRYSRYANVIECLEEAPSKILWDQVSVPRLAAKEELDILYNPKISLPLFTKVKTVGIIHGAEQFAVPQAYLWYDRLYFNFANKLYYKKAKAIITTTKIGASDAVKYMGVNSNKINIVNMAYNEKCRLLDKDKTAPVKEKYKLSDHYLMFVGGINPVKNFENILRAFAVLAKRIPHDLVAVGFWRWKFSQVQNLIDELNIRDRIIFTDLVPDEDIPALYNLADVFVFPSLYEGFGFPTLEAMACGCPVVTTLTGCTPEVVGDAALLVDPYDVKQIAGAIEKIISDSSLRAELVQKGLQRSQQFSWERCAKETLKVFEKVYRM